MVAALVALSGAVGTIGLAAVDSDAPAGATPAPAEVQPARPAPPNLDELLATADYVSEDGSHVRLGEVEISAASVSRPVPAG